MVEYQRVVIVGVGLLGGSIGMALRDRKLADCVVGYGRNTDTLQAALDAGAIDEMQLEWDAACQNADVAIVCTPVQKIADHVRACLSRMSHGAWITDVGSTKKNICEDLRSLASQFCGSHPLAGGDKSGVAHAAPNLLEKRLTVVTPSDGTPQELLQRTLRFWQLLGSRTVQMTPAEHDEAVAKTSHLPHVIASALAASTPESVLPLAATGWCDTTRVARGNVDLWVQILQENRVAVLDALSQYAGSIQHWVDALQGDNRQQIEALLTAGKQKRDSVGN